MKHTLLIICGLILGGVVGVFYFLIANIRLSLMNIQLRLEKWDLQGGLKWQAGCLPKGKDRC